MKTRQFDIITIFPEMFESPFSESILKRAQDQGLLKINLHDLRDYTLNKHRKVDDHPFGGGVGHSPGQFDQAHGIAVDSEGSVYVTENRGRRVQRFTVVR